MAARRIPVVGKTLKRGDHARLARCDLVGARAIAGCRIVNAAARLDAQVIVGDQEGKVGIRRDHLQGDHVAFGRHLRDALHNAKRTRLGFFIRVALQRGNHVIRGDGAAAVVFHARADLELPLGRISVRGHFLGNPHFDGAIGVHVDQGFTPGAVDHVGHVRGSQCRVQRVGAFAAGDTRAQNATLFGLFGMGSLGEQRTGQTGREAHGGGATHELAARHCTLANPRNHQIQLVSHCSISLRFF